jgi:putative acetyltransferase
MEGMPAASIEFRVDDLTGDATRALVARHLEGMHESSPPESVHALDLDRLVDPTVTFWSGWIEGELAVIGALKQLDDDNGEIKSMRAADGFLGRGLGRAILEHIVAQATERGMTRLWLETGSPDDFLPARKLYESAGFVECGPFGDYREDPFSVFMVRELVR